MVIGVASSDDFTLSSAGTLGPTFLDGVACVATIGAVASWRVGRGVESVLRCVVPRTGGARAWPRPIDLDVQRKTEHYRMREHR